jgi:hypothetical protein
MVEGLAREQKVSSPLLLGLAGGMTATVYFICLPVLAAWCKLRLWEWLASR